MPRHVFEADYHIGQTVRFRLDSEHVGLVVGVTFRDGVVVYNVTWRDFRDSYHYGFELQPAVQPSRSNHEG
jgi:hypothetical protein